MNSTMHWYQAHFWAFVTCFPQTFGGDNYWKLGQRMIRNMITIVWLALQPHSYWWMIWYDIGASKGCRKESQLFCFGGANSLLKSGTQSRYQASRVSKLPSSEFTWTLDKKLNTHLFRVHLDPKQETQDSLIQNSLGLWNVQTGIDGYFSFFWQGTCFKSLRLKASLSPSLSLSLSLSYNPHISRGKPHPSISVIEQKTHRALTLSPSLLSLPF